MLEQLDQLIFDYSNLYDFKEEIRRLVLRAISEISWDTIETSAVYFGRLAAFIKTFTLDEFGSIYCEREWRRPDSFRFTNSAFAMIVLPQSHIESFFADLELFPEAKRLPRNIPTVPWEDLIEH